MDIKLVVFDMDGTLIDTMDSFADYAAQLMQKNYGIELRKARSLYLDTSGLPFKQQLEQIFPEHHNTHQVANQFEEWKKSFLKNTHELRDGAVDVIRELIDHGFLICLSSNNTQKNVDYIIKRWKIKIHAALGYRYDGFQKGNAHFSWLENKFNCMRSHLLFIGDSPNDYRIANDSAVFFAALTVTFREEVFKKLDPTIPCFSNFGSIYKWILSNTV